MKRINIFILFILAFSLIKAGIVDNNLMYKAYLDNDMNVWGTELRKYTTSENLTIEDKIEISNYLYGYIPTILGNKENKEEVEKFIDIWEKYIEEIEAHGYEKSDIHVFMSALHAYQFRLHKGQLLHASKSMKEADKAMECNENNPMALSLKGNIKFYMPSFVGGSKKEAKEFYEKSLEQFSKKDIPSLKWNVVAIKLNLAQTYEKLGDKEKAISYCKEVLSLEPDFKYMRDVYLPSLTEQQ